MKEKIMVLLCWISTIVLFGCGTPKLEEKTQESDYIQMKSGNWNAKYTYLDEVEIRNYIEDENYLNKKVAMAYTKDYDCYELVFIDNNDDGDIKSKYGTTIDYNKVKINKAEVVPESIKKKSPRPILLVNESDIEIIEETIINDILASDKSYDEIEENAFIYMMDIDDGKVGYDEKYQARVDKLLEEYKEDCKQLREESEKESQEKKNIPQNTTNKYKAKFGEVLDANEYNNTLTIKFKIKPSMTNKMTVDQNGYNVEDLILNQNANKFDEIQYWAVADMTDGSESKVISFTLNKKLIDNIKQQYVVGNQIVNQSDDVWILPSLKE